MANRIDAFLDLVVKQDGSDLHLVAGNPPRIRIHGELVAVKYRELKHSEAATLIDEIMPQPVRAAFERQTSVDFAYSIAGLARFRVNAFRHVSGIGAVLRVIPTAIRTLDELDLPPVDRK